MREILFRAKSKAYGEWLYGVPYYSEDLWWLIVDANTYSDEFGTGSYSIIPETVGQYTGLKDRNGVKIFEGDLFQDEYGIVYAIKYCPEGGEYVGYSLCEGEIGLGDVVDAIMELIGNIHDNPELLEV